MTKSREAQQKGKYSENPMKICREFPQNIFHEIFSKSFPQGFSLIFKFSQNFLKTHREFAGKLSLTGFAKSIFRVLSLPEFFLEFCFTYVSNFVQQRNPSGRMALSCPMISQSDCEKAGQDE